MHSGFIKHNMRGLTSKRLKANGILYNDWEAVSPLQEECTERISAAIQLNEIAYMPHHPEILAMLKMFVNTQIQDNKKKEVLELAGYYFTRPVEELDKCVRSYLNLPPEGPYVEGKRPEYYCNLEADLAAIFLKHNPLTFKTAPSTGPVTPTTISSSFISKISSETTLQHAEAAPPPEETIEEYLTKLMEIGFEKGVNLKVTDYMIRYDTAYVEIMKAVEKAIEMTVIEIREDITQLLTTAYDNFDAIIKEKERRIAAIAWERRMGKKMKRTLRRQKNFKGYETPKTPNSGIPSSHSSYKIPPLRPCICQPQWTYNRYPKDRFGIYLPQEKQFEPTSITVNYCGNYDLEPETSIKTDSSSSSTSSQPKDVHSSLKDFHSTRS